MDAEFQGKNQDEVLEDVPEEILEPNGPCFETTDTHIKIENDEDDGNSSLQNTSNLNQAILTGLHNIKQTVKIESIDYSPSFENTDSICENGINLHGNQDTGLMNIKQDIEVGEDRLQNLHPYVEENSNIYIFENKDSNCENKDNVGQDTLVEIIKVKQEIKDTNLNIENCVSEAENMEFETYTIDSQTDPLDFSVNVNNRDDLQHNSLLNSPSCTLLNPGSQVQTITKNKFCHLYNTVPYISQVKKHRSSDDCSVRISDKFTKQPDKNCKDFILLKKDQPININGQPLTCVMCGKEVNTINCLIEHICIIPHRVMNTERQYQCSLCQRDFKTFAHLKKHFERHYDILKKRTHLCYVCGKQFKSLYHLNQHMLSHRKDRPHQCTICSKGFKTAVHLQTHMVTHSTERPHQCNVCEKDFKTTAILRMHMNCHSTERPHQCNVCEKEFNTPSLLKIHMKWHSTERLHKCQVCDKEFMISKDLRRHMISHSTERPHQCNVCDKGFKYQDTLRHHMISHNSVWPHTCSKCHKGFKTTFALQNHMVSHTEGPNQHDDGVDVNKQNQPAKPLGNHVASSKEDRPHQCSVCDKGFKDSYGLRCHMLSHSDERPQQCNVCDKKFKRLTTLRQHMICHSKACPHLCGVCAKRFKIAEDLERHMITHRTERPNQCSVCYKEYNNLPALRYHRKTKHGMVKSVWKKTSNF